MNCARPTIVRPGLGLGGSGQNLSHRNCACPACEPQLLRFRLIAEPAARATLRNWVYPLSESRDADDDRCSLCG